jgi:guanyl-specific ribonuclease Sa
MRVIRLGAWIALAVLLAGFAADWWQSRRAASEPEPVTTVAGQQLPAFLPPEAVATLELIERGGPFPYRQDGRTFENRERLLPQQPRGYYREYTVDTPGSRDRGARRIVTGGDPPQVAYYTDDHYRSFRRVEIEP